MKNNNSPSLKRIIVDFKKLTPEILALVVAKFPDGYDDRNIVQYRNAKGELIEAVEIVTQDTKYLVKVSARLEKVMEDYDDDDYANYEGNDPEAIQDPFNKG
ncbi:MAG: hypothetical protein ACI83B_002882 [Sediminicola sp.]|jgi:hypothetical protein|tara:strand:+ start:669 stop:974 length:306 start_codon:yes stop_codon:yes gene_type:complete